MSSAERYRFEFTTWHVDPTGYYLNAPSGPPVTVTAAVDKARAS